MKRGEQKDNPIQIVVDWVGKGNGNEMKKMPVYLCNCFPPKGGCNIH